MTALLGLNRSQIKKLVAKLDRRHVQQRMIEGKTIYYIEGWFAISQANAIFGFDGWDRKTLQLERVFEQTRFQETSCAYIARVRVQVKAGQSYIVREGSGFGEASATSRAAAHERALKAAETDATKRALATFGNRFGLALYDKDQTGLTGTPAQTDPPHLPAKNFNLRGPLGEVMSDHLPAEAFCGGLRQMIAKTNTLPELDGLSEANRLSLGLLHDTRKDLVSAKGIHFAQILEGLFARRRQALEGGTRQTVASEHGSVGEEISEPRSTSTGDDPMLSPALSPANQDHGVDAKALSQQAMIDKTSSLSPTGFLLSADSLPNGEVAGGMTLSVSHQLGDGAMADSISPFQNTKVDKSQLLIGAERRVRSKSHLLFVSAKPCAICGDLPCHAHHVTFAQPRGLSVKVSDEFTVPLCPMHHNLLHQNRNERAFWRQHGIDVLTLAAQLWAQTMQNVE